MNYPYRIVRFRHAAVIEVVDLHGILPDDHRRRKQQERDEAIREAEAERARVATVRFPALHGGADADSYFRSPGVFPHGWYGVGRDAPVSVYDAVPDGEWTVLEFWSDAGCRVRTADMTIEASPVWATPDQGPYWPVRLEDAGLDAALCCPCRSLFRHPDEAGFWERITSDPLDATARLVYADWLDEHDDPHAGVFREPRPFRVGSYRLDWTGAMGRVNCGPPERRPTVWGFARTTGRDGSVPFTLSDDSPLPQFVAYLLGVTRIRADGRIPAADRVALAGRLRALDLGLMADVAVGADDEPICRVNEPRRTIDLLSGVREVTADLVARLRAVNRTTTGTTEGPTPAPDTTAPDGGFDGAAGEGPTA